MSEIAACTLIQEEPDRKTEQYMMMFKDYPDVVSVDILQEMPSMPSMTEPSLSVWCRKRNPASRPQRSGSSGHALPPQSREFPSWKSCSVKSMRTTF